MATMYHNGEYLTVSGGGGTVASAVPYYYVQLTESPSLNNPIIIQGHDLDKPFKLVIQNASVNIITLKYGDFYISNGTDKLTYNLSDIGNPYRNLDERSPIATNTFTGVAGFGGSNGIGTTRLAPGTTHEFLGYKNVANNTWHLTQLTLQTSPLIQGNTHYSSSSETLYIYTQQYLSERPKPFIIATNDYTWSGTDFSEDGGNNALTVGNIHFSQNISINQMNIFGNLNIKRVRVFDVNGNQITTNIRRFIDTPPYVLGFDFTGANTYVSLTLFN